MISLCSYLCCLECINYRWHIYCNLHTFYDIEKKKSTIFLFFFGHNTSLLSYTDTRVSFVGYNNEKLFRSKMLEKESNTSVLGPVISAVVLGKDNTNLTQQVVIRMTPLQVLRICAWFYCPMSDRVASYHGYSRVYVQH